MWLVRVFCQNHFQNAFKTFVVLGAAWLALCCECALPQNEPSAMSYLVSRNQLLTPPEAAHFVQRAHDDFLHDRIDSAQKNIQRALAIFPTCASALDIQGAIYLKNGQGGAAADSFRKAIDADTSSGAPYLGLGMALVAQHLSKEALEPLDRAAALLPSLWLVHFTTAQAYLGAGDPNAALSQISISDRLAGMDLEKRASSLFLHGAICIELKDYGCAKGSLSAALAFDPSGYYAPLAKKILERRLPFSLNSEVAHTP
jgi:tetratricopeptide (TPR) repeat protein